jgi:hypothetical protein
MTEDELRLKHLADIQATISRLAQNSFTIRGWSVTLASIIFAILNTKASTTAVAWLPLLPALVFWWLDAYYLRLERLYRRLYTTAATRLTTGPLTDGPDLLPFDMNISRYTATVPNLLQTLLAPSVITIPAVLTVVITAYRLTTP